MYKMTIPLFIKALQSLDHVLSKGAHFAETKKIDVDVLLNSRLAPDQFHLIRQVQIACDTVKLGAARLTGKTAPTHDDSEKTLPQLKDRISETITFLKSLNESDFKGSEEKHITTPRWEGKYLLGQDYVTHHALPNLYFHVTTAYSILRHNGVELGKKDYLGEIPFRS